MNLIISRTQAVIIFLVFVQFFLPGCRIFPMSEDSRAFYYGADTKITFRVVDHKGNPVEEADVRITMSGGVKSLTDRQVILHEKSDKKGRVIVERKSTGSFRLRIKKEGYYRTYDGYSFPRTPNGATLKDGRWLPWNPTANVLLKPKLKPVSMYIKSIDKTEIPLNGKPVGYDFKVADWVEPFGKGKVADLSFTFTGYLKDYWTGGSELVISAPGPKSGIQILKKDMVSDFKSVYQAPLDGYKKKMSFFEEQTKEEGFIRRKQLEKDEYLVFRTRTKVDEQGNLVEAYYGKIYPPLEFGPFQMDREKSKGKIGFRFYFNPHGTRNLEHAWDKNLF